jgi:hypothetical protein
MWQGLERCGCNGQSETPVDLWCVGLLNILRDENKNMVFHSLLWYIDTCLLGSFVWEAVKKWVSCKSAQLKVQLWREDFMCDIWSMWSRDSVVGVATGYGLDDRGVGVWVPVGSTIFSTSSRLALGPTQPPLQWVPGAFSPGVKRPGHEADHSAPTNVEGKKMWIHTATPPYAFMA